jgi:hypothetical protein
MPFQPKLTPDQVQALQKDYKEGWTVQELTIIYRVSKRTVYRKLNLGRVPPKPKRFNPSKPARPLEPCGTNAAYQRHRKAGEYPCIPCLEAHAENVRLAKARKRKQNVKSKRSRP